jgi:hypothetical protein
MQRSPLAALFNMPFMRRRLPAPTGLHCAAPRGTGQRFPGFLFRGSFVTTGFCIPERTALPRSTGCLTTVSVWDVTWGFSVAYCSRIPFKMPPVTQAEPTLERSRPRDHPCASAGRNGEDRRKLRGQFDCRQIGFWPVLVVASSPADGGLGALASSRQNLSRQRQATSGGAGRPPRRGIGA